MLLLGLPQAPATQLSMLVVRRSLAAADMLLGRPQFCWLLRMKDACCEEDWLPLLCTPAAITEHKTCWLVLTFTAARVLQTAA
jgi:hypothetical protein